MQINNNSFNFGTNHFTKNNSVIQNNSYVSNYNSNRVDNSNFSTIERYSLNKTT